MKFTAAKDYDNLLKQCNALLTIIDVKKKEVLYYQTNYYSKSQVAYLQEKLDDELSTNETLTNQVEKLEAENAELRTQVKVMSNLKDAG